ncbi:hypothetical protein GCM10009069_02020 [Algimonas arctica]|uniref:Uncharacterized protein n=1 Tax=Algimonas arctica TaxID=1479486 RepID=A0A8J3CPC2_9PROT|nr:hypothetical protein [Algimonas arctica]GHA82459.1 hypothetical protein GCM10009069_02020 [Algimonas arctica]
MSKLAEFSEYNFRESASRYVETLRSFARYILLGGGASLAFIANRIFQEGSNLGNNWAVKATIVFFAAAIITSGITLVLQILFSKFEADNAANTYGFLVGYRYTDDQEIGAEMTTQLKAFQGKSELFPRILFGSSCFSGILFSAGIITSVIFLFGILQ